MSILLLSESGTVVPLILPFGIPPRQCSTQNMWGGGGHPTRQKDHFETRRLWQKRREQGTGATGSTTAAVSGSPLPEEGGGGGLACRRGRGGGGRGLEKGPSPLPHGQCCWRVPSTNVSLWHLRHPRSCQARPGQSPVTFGQSCSICTGLRRVWCGPHNDVNRRFGGGGGGGVSVLDEGLIACKSRGE